MKFEKTIVKFLSLAMIFSLALPIYATEGDSTTEEEEEPLTGFQDVEGHWAEDVIWDLYDRGLVSGVSDLEFQPNGTMKRAEFITVVVRYLYPTAEFTDGKYWYSGYYDIAYGDGLLPLTFREQYLDQNITRQEMTYIVVKALAIMGETPTEYISEKQIADYSSIGSTYQAQVIDAYSLGIVGGSEEGNFNPNNTGTRAECAIVLLNMVDSTNRITPNFAANPGAMTDMNRLDVSYTKTRDTITLDLNDSSRPVAKVGDVVTVSGKQITIGYHPSMATVNGLAVPYLAGVALDQGIDTNSIYGVVDDGFSGGAIHYNGETYYINPHTGEGYWQSQWTAIQTRVPAPRAYGTTEGQISTDNYKLWTWNHSAYQWEASYLYGRT